MKRPVVFTDEEKKSGRAVVELTNIDMLIRDQEKVVEDEKSKLLPLYKRKKEIEKQIKEGEL